MFLHYAENAIYYGFRQLEVTGRRGNCLAILAYHSVKERGWGGEALVVQVSLEELALPRLVRCEPSRLRCHGHNLLLSSYLCRIISNSLPSGLSRIWASPARHLWHNLFHFWPLVQTLWRGSKIFFRVLLFLRKTLIFAKNWRKMIN